MNLLKLMNVNRDVPSPIRVIIRGQTIIIREIVTPIVILDEITMMSARIVNGAEIES